MESGSETSISRVGCHPFPRCFSSSFGISRALESYHPGLLMNGSTPAEFTPLQRIKAAGVEGNGNALPNNQYLDFLRHSDLSQTPDDIGVDAFGNNVCSLCCVVLGGENGDSVSHLRSEKHLTNSARFKTLAERERARNQFVYSLLVDDMLPSKRRICENMYAGDMESSGKFEHDMLPKVVKDDLFLTSPASQKTSRAMSSLNDISQRFSSLTMSSSMDDDAKLVRFVNDVPFCILCGTEVAGTSTDFKTHCRGKRHIYRKKRLVTPLMMRLNRHNKHMASTKQASSFSKRTPCRKSRRHPSKCTVIYKDAERSFALALANLSINKDHRSSDEETSQTQAPPQNSKLPLVPFQAVSTNTVSNSEKDSCAQRENLSLEERLRTSLYLDSMFRSDFKGVGANLSHDGDHHGNNAYTPQNLDDVDMATFRGEWRGMNIVIKDVADDVQKNFKEEIFEIE